MWVQMWVLVWREFVAQCYLSPRLSDEVILVDCDQAPPIQFRQNFVVFEAENQNLSQIIDKYDQYWSKWDYMKMYNPSRRKIM